VTNTPKPSNYEVFRQADFNRPEHYPLDQSVSPELYRPLATWMGRLILPTPEERTAVEGAWLELHHVGAEYEHLVGQVLHLRWNHLPDVMSRVWSAARDVYLSEAAEQSLAEGLVHPTRLDRWRLVTSLESLAGARPNDDVIVMLREPVKVIESPEEDERASLYINREPVQITGRYYALVKFLEPVQAGGDLFRVVHFNRTTRQFDGPDEVVQLPETVIDTDNLHRSSSHGIEKDPLNETGWYISGAKDPQGTFVGRDTRNLTFFIISELRHDITQCVLISWCRWLSRA
jgi:predicted Abi (CAAX) family protease